MIHREMLWSVIVRFLDDRDSLTSLGKVLCANATTTATTYDHHIGVDNLRLFAGWKLEKAVVEAFTWFAVNGHSGKAEDVTKGRALLCPRCCYEALERFDTLTEKRQVR